MRIFLSTALNDPKYHRTRANFKEQLENNKLTVEWLAKTRDIWLRDFMPVQTGEERFVQFRLFPGYYEKHEKHLATDPAPICSKLGIKLEILLFRGKRIILDGGNVVKGHNMAIITEKVFKDNPGPCEELTEILKAALNVAQIIFIPPEPGERLGHADGIARFFDEKTVIVNDYNIKEFPMAFREKLYGALKEVGMEMYTVPYYPVMKEIHGIEPALGCYINYYQAEETIFLPTFDNSTQDQIAISRFEELFGKGNVVPIPCKPIAMEGGALNCITWEMVV